MKCKSCGKDLCKDNKTGYCRECSNKRPEVRKKNSESVKASYITGRDFSPDSSERMQQGQRKGREVSAAKKAQEIIDNPYREYSNQRLRNLLLFLGREEKCEICGLAEWRGKPLTVEVHHMVSRLDNRPESLQFVCPNCHSQTDSYKGASAKKGKFDKNGIPENKIWEAWLRNKNVRQTLIDLGLDPKGANYARVYSVIEKFEKMAS